MQMNKKNLKVYIISAIIIVIILFGCFMISKLLKKNKEYVYLRNYGVNEYIPTYVSTGDLVKIYLNDYIYKAKYDTEKAYYLIEEEYRKVKFPSISDYKNYIGRYIGKNIKLKKYSIHKKDGYTFYNVYDEEGNIYIFKSNGVMQYTIYLDENTVEVK